MTMVGANTCFLTKIVSIKELKLSLKELELKEKNRSIKRYKSMSIYKLLNISVHQNQ